MKDLKFILILLVIFTAAACGTKNKIVTTGTPKPIDEVVVQMNTSNVGKYVFSIGENNQASLENLETGEIVVETLTAGENGEFQVVFSFVHSPEATIVKEANSSEYRLIVGGVEAIFDVDTDEQDANINEQDANINEEDVNTNDSIIETVGTNETLKFVSVAAGATHSCAVSDDGNTWCWGSNSFGQLGYQETVSALAQKVVVVDDATTVSADNNSTCATKIDGTVWCWGAIAEPSPVIQIEGIDNAVDVVLSEENNEVYIVRNDGTVWLRDNNGIIEQLEVFENIINLEVYKDTKDWIYAVTNEGTLWWSTDKGVSVNHTACSSPISIFATNTLDTCFIRSDGGLKCQNFSNPDLDNITQVSIGEGHACVIEGNETVKCWGSNSFGQLGNGIFEDNETPTNVFF